MDLLLVATILLPAIGAVVIWTVAPLGNTQVRLAALATTLVTLAMVGCLVSNYPLDGSLEGVAFEFSTSWLGADSGFDVGFNVGLDGISLWMFALSALLMVTSVLVSWQAIQDRPALFFSMLLLLETGCLGVFAARDIILFYVFFEFTLIPLFFLIGIWGSEDRQWAATKFFLFTLAGSLLTFLGLLTLVLWDYLIVTDGQQMTFSIEKLTESIVMGRQTMPLALQVGVFLALFAGFAIKVPLFPLHTWLPLAHVQAPTAGSVFLAGILLKIGTYGFLRFNIAMLPGATALLAPWLLWLAVAGIVYGALVALVQTDIKKLIAYSSVSHLGYCMLGLFALNKLGAEGAMLQMINHGISTGALFALVGMIYERYHTREIKQLGGLAYRTPILAFFLVLFTMSSIGLPGMNGFAGEILILLGMFQRAWADDAGQFVLHYRIISVIAVFGVVLGAWYMLWLLQRILFGPLHEPSSGQHGKEVSDLSLREISSLVPLAIFVFWIGLYPTFFLRPISGDLQRTTRRAMIEFQRQSTMPTTIKPPVFAGTIDGQGNEVTYVD